MFSKVLHENKKHVFYFYLKQNELFGQLNRFWGYFDFLSRVSPLLIFLKQLFWLLFTFPKSSLHDQLVNFVKIWVGMPIVVHWVLDEFGYIWYCSNTESSHPGTQHICLWRLVSCPTMKFYRFCFMGFTWVSFWTLRHIFWPLSFSPLPYFLPPSLPPFFLPSFLFFLLPSKIDCKPLPGWK